jgi:hypothetical protein
MADAKDTPECGAKLLRSMILRAAHLDSRHDRSTLITEHIDGVCVQCEGRTVYRNTLDGRQPSVAFYWFIDCKRSSKAKVFRRFAGAGIAVVQQEGSAS